MESDVMRSGRGDEGGHWERRRYGLYVWRSQGEEGKRKRRRARGESEEERRWAQNRASPWPVMKKPRDARLEKQMARDGVEVVEKYLWLLYFEREGTKGIICPFYAVDETEAMDMLAEITHSEIPFITPERLVRAPQGYHAYYAYCPGTIHVGYVWCPGTIRVRADGSVVA